MENFRDAELKKWLAEEYEKETEEMERILFPDGVIPDDGETEEEAKAAYQRLVEKLKADGVYKEDETDSIKTDDHKENVKIVYLPEKKSHKTGICMDGQEVFKFAARMVPKSINKVLDEAGVSKEEIKYFVLHQANKRIIEAAARRLKQPIEKFPMNIDRCANTSSATIPILLDEINQKGMLNRGDKIVLSGFGGGLTWGSVYLTW